MKNTKALKALSLALLGTAMAVFAGCSKNEETKATEAVSQDTPASSPVEQSYVVEEVPAAAAIKFIPGTCIYDDEFSLWVPNANGDMVWFKTVLKGSEVSLYPSEDNPNVPEVLKDVNRISGGQSVKRDFTHCVYEGSDCYIQTNITIAAAKPAVCVTPKTFLYTKADLSAMRNPSIEVPLNDIIAVYEDQSDAADTIFIKVAVRVNEVTYENVYIKKNALSDNDRDLLARQFILRAQITSSKTTRTEALALAKAVSVNPAQSISELYEETVLSYELNDSFLNSDILNSEFYGKPLQIKTGDGSNVTVRDLPSKSSTAKTVLADGTPVRYIRVTSSEYTVDGKTDRWYYISSMVRPNGDIVPGVEGWVFGAFLSDYEGEAEYEW